MYLWEMKIKGEHASFKFCETNNGRSSKIDGHDYVQNYLPSYEKTKAIVCAGRELKDKLGADCIYIRSKELFSYVRLQYIKRIEVKTEKRNIELQYFELQYSEQGKLELLTGRNYDLTKKEQNAILEFACALKLYGLFL